MFKLSRLYIISFILLFQLQSFGSSGILYFFKHPSQLFHEPTKESLADFSKKKLTEFPSSKGTLSYGSVTRQDQILFFDERPWDSKDKGVRTENFRASITLKNKNLQVRETTSTKDFFSKELQSKEYTVKNHAISYIYPNNFAIALYDPFILESDKYGRTEMAFRTLLGRKQGVFLGYFQKKETDPHFSFHGKGTLHSDHDGEIALTSDNNGIYLIENYDDSAPKRDVTAIFHKDGLKADVVKPLLNSYLSARTRARVLLGTTALVGVAGALYAAKQGMFNNLPAFFFIKCIPAFEPKNSIFQK